MRIALTQMDQEWENKEANLGICESLIIEVKKNGADLVIFPEMTLTGFSMNYSLVAEERDSKTLENFRKFSQRYEIGIIFGLVNKLDNYGSNTSIFLSREGIVLGSYDKIHPFSFAGEDANIKGGESLSVVENNNLSIGMTICYDLRFPEIYTALAQECDLIINIANWPAKRNNQWLSLLKARAIENQVYLAGVNRIGIDGNEIAYMKSSLLVDPNGEVTKSLLEKDNFVIYEINKSMVSNFRKDFSTTRDRRPNLYKSFYKSN